MRASRGGRWGLETQGALADSLALGYYLSPLRGSLPNDYSFSGTVTGRPPKDDRPLWPDHGAVETSLVGCVGVNDDE